MRTGTAAAWLTALFVMAGVPAAMAQTNDKDETFKSITAVKNEVRETFDQFRRAVLRGDRESIKFMLTGEAIHYGGVLLRMAQTWGPARLSRQSVATQISVLSLRLDTEPEELMAMKPEEAFARTYEVGVLDPLVFEAMLLVELDLAGDNKSATARVGIGDKATNATVSFAKHDGRWHVDPFNINNEVSLALSRYIKARGEDEKAYVSRYMTETYGDWYDESSWQPAQP